MEISAGPVDPWTPCYLLCGSGAIELLVHRIVFRPVDHELQVHEGIIPALISTFGLAMAARILKQPMRQRPPGLRRDRSCLDLNHGGIG